MQAQEGLGGIGDGAGRPAQEVPPSQARSALGSAERTRQESSEDFIDLRISSRRSAAAR